MGSSRASTPDPNTAGVAPPAADNLCAAFSCPRNRIRSVVTPSRKGLRPGAPAISMVSLEFLLVPHVDTICQDRYCPRHEIKDCAGARNVAPGSAQEKR